MKVDACIKCNGNCFACFYAYAGECEYLLIDESMPIPQIEVDTASMSLCEGRHPIPDAKDGSIFTTEINPLDVEGLEAEAEAKLFALNIRKLNLYVTGLTVALIAVLNAARKLNIAVTLYHYDRETGNYYPQEVK